MPVHLPMFSSDEPWPTNAPVGTTVYWDGEFWYWDGEMWIDSWDMKYRFGWWTDRISHLPFTLGVTSDYNIEVPPGYSMISPSRYIETTENTNWVGWQQPGTAYFRQDIRNSIGTPLGLHVMSMYVDVGVAGCVAGDEITLIVNEEEYQRYVVTQGDIDTSATIAMSFTNRLIYAASITVWVRAPQTATLGYCDYKVEAIESSVFTPRRKLVAWRAGVATNGTTVTVTWDPAENGIPDDFLVRVLTPGASQVFSVTASVAVNKTVGQAVFTLGAGIYAVTLVPQGTFEVTDQYVSEQLIGWAEVA